MQETRTGLIQVALGKIPPELIIGNIQMVNVYSGEILAGQQVAIWQGRIAYVGPNPPQAGEETKFIDGQGMFLLPGFLDVHGHADFITNPLALAKEIIPTGTTGMLTDTHDICGSMGAKGLEMMLEGTTDIPFRYYLATPVANPPLPEFEGQEIFSTPEVGECLSQERVLAVSEVTAWGRLLLPEQEMLSKLVLARKLGKRIEGHMAGCSDNKLNALIASGFTSCHESINAEEALQRLRLGLYVILRHGSIRADLEPLSHLITDNPALDTSRVMLSPDWFSPQDVLKYGYMNYLITEAVRLGIPPVKAIQMVTINPATYLGLDGDIGGIAPGRFADLQLVEHLDKPFPKLVLVDGKIVAQDGKILVDLPQFPSSSIQDWRQVRIPRVPVQNSDFELKIDQQANQPANQNFPCIHMVNKTITKEGSVTLPIHNGLAVISTIPGLLKISLWSAHKNGWMTGLLTGFGAVVGGIASSLAHELHAPMVVGCNEEDMALAANRMLAIGGGVVIVQHGQVVGELPLVVGGTISNASVGEVAEGWNKLNHYLQEHGCPWDDPLFGLGFLGFTGLPYVRITPSGIVDIRKKELVFP